MLVWMKFAHRAQKSDFILKWARSNCIDSQKKQRCSLRLPKFILSAIRFCANWTLPLLATFPDSYRELVGGESLWGRSAPKPPLHKTYWSEVYMAS